MNVLYEGARVTRHAHVGPSYAFVWHLTDGEDLIFYPSGAPTERRQTKPGQLLVFETSIEHETEPHTRSTPRVSIAGNLDFGTP